MEAAEESIKELQPFLNDNVVENIRKSLKVFNEIKPATFESYQEIVEYETNFRNIVGNLINEGLVTFPDPETSNESSQYFSSLYTLKLKANEMACLKRRDIIQNMKFSNKEEMLYGNIMFTEEEINKRYKKIALLFHPDKTSRPYTPYFLQGEYNNLGNKLFKLGLKLKEKLLAKLENALLENEGCTFHEKCANNLWKIAIDYRNAAKGQWNNLKLLNKEDIKDLSSEELKRHSVNHGLFAYNEYRAACKIVDKAKQLKDQMRLRGNMALCFYVSNKELEAQLYALSAIKLHLKNSNQVTHELNEAKKIFDKVRGKNATEETHKPASEINLKDNFGNTQALVKLGREISFFEKKSYQRSIDDDILKISTDLMLNADRSLVRYQITNEEILQVKNNANNYKFVGGGIMSVGATVGLTTATLSGLKVSTAVALGISTVGGPIGLAIGLITIGLGIWFGCSLWNEGRKKLEVPKILKKLNDIMKEALKAYDEDDHQKFIDILSKEYDKDTRLLNLKDSLDVIDPKIIVDKLLRYGFRPDGIAYLLILLGEVLNIGKIKINGKTTNELKSLAKIVYKGVNYEKLYEKAQKLDERIRGIRKNNKFIQLYNQIIDFILLKTEYSNIAKEHIDDNQEMPFQTRLEEMQNIANINFAIFDILDGGEQERDRAIKTIKEIRNKSHSFRFAELRLEILEDFLWVISGEEISHKSVELPKITFPAESI
ncbi:10987_t:CDS:1 [Funneliformis geosporum]|uniref:17776_t:CDS:1 n=1 Tax=Funneliformis geosporum TaxID=1117311 RepID=A0A9W4SNW7_9GLOM|nr:10987_t:CDS:1 [Funneliformis geosporum]CAI2173857.1 17776_t:CDS:1 [Funneliformis geosporum]